MRSTHDATRVKTYGEFVQEYEVHAESKCAAADGTPCGKQTTGLLDRRRVVIEQIKYIGKESNSLEEVESGTQHSAENVYTEYPDPRGDEWEIKIRPILKKLKISELAKMTGLSRRTLIDARSGKRRPHPKNQRIVIDALSESKITPHVVVLEKSPL